MNENDGNKKISLSSWLAFLCFVSIIGIPWYILATGDITWAEALPGLIIWTVIGVLAAATATNTSKKARPKTKVNSKTKVDFGGVGDRGENPSPPHPSAKPERTRAIEFPQVDPSTNPFKTLHKAVADSDAGGDDEN